VALGPDAHQKVVMEGVMEVGRYFLLAMHLHPWIQSRCFTKTFSRLALYNMAEKVFQRAFEEEPSWMLLQEFINYSDGTRLYLNESTRLTYWKQKHEELVHYDSVCKGLEIYNLNVH
jgi:hypothetical protein